MQRALDTEDAHQLFVEGQQALSQVEVNGMRLDMEYLDKMIEATGEKVRQMDEDLKKDEVWQTWKKVYGDDASLSAKPQLGHIIFDVLKVPCKRRTPSGRPAVDEEALEEVDFPFLKKYINRNKLEKARGTNLMGLRREAIDGRLHPHQNLNTTITFRSSVSDPNGQNIPIRDPRMAYLVRRAFIPTSDDFRLLEIDLSGAEVRVSACYHRDPRMINYIEQNYDYHHELAMQCYKLDTEQVSKPIRGTAKGGFVFASFYGDWYKQICQNLWGAVDRDHLTLKNGMSLREHLNLVGLDELGDLGRDPRPGTFENHIKEVYEDFWGVRFPVYAQWKVDWWNAYLDKGYCQSLTGFTYKGVYEKNKIINYPIQGSSFHCLLWILIKVNKWLVKNKMRSKIIMQIHDSILFDVHKDELQDVLAYVYQLMIHEIQKVWPWIIVQLDGEAAVCEKNWYEKEEIKFAA
jgi:DNA polymerase-1